jgi:putative transposase
MLRDLLRAKGYRVGRRHVVTLMRRMGIEALYRKRLTSRRDPENPVFPYLLRHLSIERPNHVWCADITYIPMRHGFLYLFAVLDWATRRVLAWRLSNTLTTDFCIDAVREAIETYESPQILNTDQGSQFTDKDFVALIRDEHGIALSMDGKGAWRDNVFVERFGNHSSTKKSTCTRTRASLKRKPASASTSHSTTAFGHTRHSTDVRRIPYTSVQLPTWRPNFAEPST